jgi:hypothetical protein
MVYAIEIVVYIRYKLKIGGVRSFLTEERQDYASGSFR